MSAEPVAGAGEITDEWIVDHFDVHAPELGADLHDTLARARRLCPVARSDVYEGGYWVATTVRGRAPRRPGLGDVEQPARHHRRSRAARTWRG